MSIPYESAFISLSCNALPATLGRPPSPFPTHGKGAINVCSSSFPINSQSFFLQLTRLAFFRDQQQMKAMHGLCHKCNAIICVGVKIKSRNERKIKSELMSNFVLSQTRSLGIRHGRAFMWRHSPFTTIVPAEWMVVKLHVGQRGRR